MFKHLKIGVKLPVFVILVGVISLGIADYIANSKIQGTIRAAGQDRLLAVAQSRAAEIGIAFQAVQSDLSGKSANPLILDAARAFVFSWGHFGSDPAGDLRRAYIDENPFEPDERHKYLSAEDRSAYSKVHRRYHPFFRASVAGHNYADLYLISPEGRVVYNVSKDDAFGRDLTAPEASGHELARVFRMAMRDGAPPGIFTTEFAPRATTGTRPTDASAIAAVPIRSEVGTVEAIVAVRLSARGLTEILSRENGLGRTGKAYLLSPTGDIFAQSGGAGSAQVEFPPALRGRIAAIGEMSHGMIIEDGPDDGQVNAIAPVQIMEAPLALLMRQDAREILAPAQDIRRGILEDGFRALALISVFGFLIARSISVPLGRVEEAMREVEAGNYDSALPDRARGDEIGAISRRLELFRASLLENEVLARENAFKRAAFESTSAALMLVDRDLTIIYVNSRLVGLMRVHRIALDRMVQNFRPEGLSGRSLASFLPGADSMVAALEEESVITRDLLIGNAHLRVRLGAVRSGTGDTLGYVVEWQDISIDHGNRQLLEAVNARIPVAAFSPEGRFLHANAPFIRWLKLTPGELIGRTWSMIFAPDDAVAQTAWSEAKEAAGDGRRMHVTPDGGHSGGADINLSAVSGTGGGIEAYVLVAAEWLDDHADPVPPAAPGHPVIPRPARAGA